MVRDSNFPGVISQRISDVEHPPQITTFKLESPKEDSMEFVMKSDPESRKKDYVKYTTRLEP